MKKIPTPLTRPWAISEEGMQLVLAVWSRGALFADVREKALEARKGKPLENTRTTTVPPGTNVAVVPIEDTLFRKADLFTDISGGTSYETLRKDIQQALDNPAVEAILLNINSPGGEADGCNELARFILESRAKKPIWAYVGGYGASGAYWLAAAADKIICEETAFLGSIGVRLTIFDDSKRDEAMGVREVEIISSQSPDKRSSPVNDELIERYQARIDDLAQIFVEFVAEGRNTTAADVIENFGSGGVLIGARAVKAGMADAIGSFESALAQLSAKHTTPAAPRVTAMEKKMAKEKDAVVSMQTEKCDACGVPMTGNAYCQGCFDGDEDEEDAKALGLNPTAKRSERLARASALASFEQKIVAATGCQTAAEAVGKVAATVDASARLAAAQTELEKVRVEGIRRDLRATLETGLDRGRLSLGAIQKSIPLVLRGEQKTGWSAAMGKIAEVTRESVLDAACSVSLSADDLAAIVEFSKSAAPIAAEPFIEPKRDANGESAELDETAQQIKAAADAARRSLDRGMAAQAK